MLQSTPTSDGSSLEAPEGTFLPFPALLIVCQEYTRSQHKCSIPCTAPATCSEWSHFQQGERWNEWQTLGKATHHPPQGTIPAVLVSPFQSKEASCHCAKIHAMFNTIRTTTVINRVTFFCLLLARTPHNTERLTKDLHWLVRIFKIWWSSKAEELWFKKVKWWATCLIFQFLRTILP